MKSLGFFSTFSSPSSFCRFLSHNPCEMRFYCFYLFESYKFQGTKYRDNGRPLTFSSGLRHPPSSGNTSKPGRYNQTDRTWATLANSSTNHNLVPPSKVGGLGPARWA